MAVSFRTNMRHSSPANNFRKTARCPSSQTLLRYRRHRLPIADRAEIEIHLRACDFCSAEVQLLTRHRNYVEESRVVEMPRQLRRLAEDLLTRSTIPFGLIGFDANRQSH
jgi:hypothetical protein